MALASKMSGFKRFRDTCRRNALGIAILLCVVASLPIYYHSISEDELLMVLMYVFFLSIFPISIVMLVRNTVFSLVVLFGLMFFGLTVGGMSGTVLGYVVILSSAIPVWIVLSFFEKFCISREARRVRQAPQKVDRVG